MCSPPKSSLLLSPFTLSDLPPPPAATVFHPILTPHTHSPPSSVPWSESLSLHWTSSSGLTGSEPHDPEPQLLGVSPAHAADPGQRLPGVLSSHSRQRVALGLLTEHPARAWSWDLSNQNRVTYLKHDQPRAWEALPALPGHMGPVSTMSVSLVYTNRLKGW